MTSNHFLFVILYFLSNFFLFIAEASASTDQELKTKFFNDQCQTSCSPEFKACYQKLSETDRNAIMNDLIGRRVLQKVQTVEGSGFYNYGSDAIPTATAKTEFNKAVGSKCQAIAMAEAKAAQSQVAKSSGSSSSGKSDSGGGSGGGDLLAAAKEMAPLALAVPGVKEAYDKAKEKGKEVVENVTGIKLGKDKKTIDPENTNVGDVTKSGGPSSSVSSSNPNAPANNSQSSNSQPTNTDPKPDFSVKSTAMQEKTSTQISDTSKPVDQNILEMAKKNAAVASDKIKPSSPEAAKNGNDIAAEKDATQLDTEGQAKMSEAQSKATEFKKNIDSVIQQLRDRPPVVTEFSQSGCRAELTQLQKSSDKYIITRETCSADTARATNLCSTVRSPQAQKTQQVLSAGTAVLSKATAASESCGIMGNISTIANAGMLSAQAICSGMKIKCELSCASGLAEIEKIVNEDLSNLRTCATHHGTDISGALLNQANFARVQENYALESQKRDLASNNSSYAEFIGQGFVSLETSFNKEKEQSASIPTATVDCKKNEADILTMGAQAAALLSAAMDSKKCEEQLSSGDGSGSGSLATTAQFCAQPGNSSSITCRCAADPSGAGCLGSLGGGSDVSGFAGLQKGVGNVSGFSSTGAPKISDSDIQFSDIPSDVAAKTDNGLSPTSPFAAAQGVGTGGSAGGSGAAGSAKPGGVGSEEEKSKGFSMGFSSLAKGFGNLFGLKGNDKVGKTLSTEQKSIQLQAIKRKIASDQIRAEISTASGKSNFDKIKDRYAETRSSLISSP